MSNGPLRAESVPRRLPLVAWRWWICGLVMSMAIGCAATVGVAWWCAWRSPQDPDKPGVQARAGPGAFMGGLVSFSRADADFGLVIVGKTRWMSELCRGASIKPGDPPGKMNRDRLPEWSAIGPYEGPLDVPTPPVAAETMLHELGCGWPWVTMVARVQGPAETPPFRRTTRGIVLQGMSGVYPRLLPTVIVWRGFAASAGIVAGAVMLVLLAVALARRLMRRVGVCTHCGYDLSGVPVAVGEAGVRGRTCPECGREGNT